LLKGWRYRKNNNNAIQELITEVQRCVNEYIFGTAYWNIPLKHDGTMDNIKLANWCAHIFVDHLDIFIELCIPKEKIEEINERKKVNIIV
jgi:hypothetical protein